MASWLSATVSAVAVFPGKAVKAIKSLDVQHGKPVVPIVNPRKTVVPIIIASVLFFTWGLTYGLLDVMNVSSSPNPCFLGHADRYSITSASQSAPSETRLRCWPWATTWPTSLVPRFLPDP